MIEPEEGNPDFRPVHDPRPPVPIPPPVKLLAIRDVTLLIPPGQEHWWDRLAYEIFLFDPATVQPGPVHVVADLPGQARRLFAGATGIERVLVNGIEVVEAGRLTGEHPGRVLRSGRDTETMSVASQAG